VRRFLAVAARFVGQVAQAQARDNISLHAGALAYTTLVSLVPLLTVALVTVARIQPERAEVVVRAIATMLPFSPARVQATLTMFAERTLSLGWPAVAVSVLVALFTFYQIDEVVNTVWGVPQRRPWRWRIVSFFLVLFWGPVLLTALFSGLYWLSAQPWYPAVAPAARPLPALFAFAALAGLYRWVPHTHVRWRAAAAGAAAATALIILLHLGFQLYVEAASDLNVVYGSLAVLLFFLVSLYFFWLAILLGAEVSWVAGHFSVPSAPPAAAVVALVEILRRQGKVSRDQARALLGAAAEQSLAALSARPALLEPDPDGWHLVVPEETVTVALVSDRLGGRLPEPLEEPPALASPPPAAPPDAGNTHGDAETPTSDSPPSSSPPPP
jgi:membrane protein